MTIHLRPYQVQALAALAAHRQDRPDETRLLVQMATGLGKTITFAHEAVEHLYDHPSRRVLILVHTDELTQQAAAKVALVAKGYRNPVFPPRIVSVGIVKAERDEVDADIIIGSVQTLANPARRARLRDVDLIIVDEAHHALAGTYQAILRHFGALPYCDHSGRAIGDPGCWDCRGTGFLEPPVPVTGYTATPERGDGKALGHVWQNIVFSRQTSWAVRKGYLVPPIGYTVTVPQLGQGAVPAASLSAPALDTALVDGIAPVRVVDAWLEHGQGRSTVLFAPLVRSAEAFAAAFRAAGISAAVVHGAMPAEDRALTLKRYAAGDIEVLCNAMVLTEGWDAPRTKCVIWARPTGSRSLFIQGVGRGLRPWLDGPISRSEQDCVLLVVSDSTPGLVSIADLSDRPIEPEDGKSLLALEDEYDLSTDLEPDAPNAYAGRVDVAQFDPLLARSEKVWMRTAAGALFVPLVKGSYLAVLPDAPGYAVAAVRPGGGRVIERRVPDLELAMSLAEDEAQERGGDLGRLLADKTRPWRKGVPSEDAKAEAKRLGLAAELEAIMASRSSGKAGRLSDRIAIVKASRLIDPAVEKLRKAGA